MDKSTTQPGKMAENRILFSVVLVWLISIQFDRCRKIREYSKETKAVDTAEFLCITTLLGIGVFSE